MTPSRPTRVLVVDDSALYRQAICNVLRKEPNVVVVGIAKNGVEALEQIGTLDPDLLTLDVQMPDMDGIEVLREINRRGLRAGALMVSSFTSEGANVTTDALLEGAFDFILKPSGSDLAANRRTLQTALEEKIGAFRGSGPALARRLLRRSRPPEPGTYAEETPTGATTCEAVLIATSTGGPAALKEVLPRLPADLGVPVLIVQHMPERYTHALAQRLDQMSPLAVEEARDGMRIEPGRVLLAPGGHQMKVSGHAGALFVRVTDDPPENACLPSADYTFRSAAKAFAGATLAVVLTGMGRDGLLGCVAVKQAGGVVFAQDEDSATVYGMPKAVADEGVADRIVPLDRMSHAIERFVRNARA